MLAHTFPKIWVDPGTKRSYGKCALRLVPYGFDTARPASWEAYSAHFPEIHRGKSILAVGYEVRRPGRTFHSAHFP